MSPFDPVTTDSRPVSLRVLDTLLGGVLRLVAGGQSSGFDDNDKHLLDIAERMDLVDMEVGFNEPDTYQLAPLGQALLDEMEPSEESTQDPDSGPLVLDERVVFTIGPRASSDPACLSIIDEHDASAADSWTDIAARETWLHQDEETGAILATPVSDQPAELLRAPTVNEEGIARWRQEARDREANDYLQALRDGEIEPRPCTVTSVEPSRFTVVVRLRGFEEPEAVATRVRQTLETHPTLSMRVDEVVASDPMWTPQSSKVEGMRDGQDWAASAVQAAVNGEPWDTEGATPSLRGTLRALPVLIARREAEALRPIALALGWTEKDEVSGADIQDRVEGWAQERTEAVTLLRDRDDSLTWVEYGQRAEDDAARATRFEGSDLICEVLRERNWRWSTLAKMSAPVMLAMDPAADPDAFVAALTNVGPERSTVYMLDSTRLDELNLQPGDTLSVKEAATGPTPMMSGIPLVDILQASGLDLSPAGLQRELEAAKARPWIEAPWICKERDSFSGQETWTLPEGAYAMIEQEDGNGVRRDSWRLVLTSPRYTDPLHARNVGNRIVERFRDACTSGGLAEVEPGVYGLVNGRLQEEQ